MRSKNFPIWFWMTVFIVAFFLPLILLNLSNPAPRLSIEAEIARQRMAETKQDSTSDDIQISQGDEYEQH